MLTDAELQSIRERAEKATPGPWEGHDTCDAVTSGATWVIDVSQEGYINHEDTDFIAHAREDIPRLLAEIDRLKQFEPSPADYAHARASVDGDLM